MSRTLNINCEDEDANEDGNKRDLLVEEGVVLQGPQEETVLNEEPHESFFSIGIQVFIPFLIAGSGMVCAGLVLDYAQHSPVFVTMPEIFILVPALLGLKGNLEMTLASRLSTQANLGNLDGSREKWEMSVANLSLVQCQAIVVGFLASVGAFVLGYIADGQLDFDHAFILFTSSIVTASAASFVLGLIMVLVIAVSKHFGVNPDNIATPIAAGLGDVTTLALLAGISKVLFDTVETQKWVCPTILAFYVASMPCWIKIAMSHISTKKVLRNGWTPILCAMMISSVGGLILDITIKTFTGVAVFQPVINGAGGNLVAVQASRLSTSFHRRTRLGVLPKGVNKMVPSPWETFITGGRHALTARVLLLLVIPGHLIFACSISYLQAGDLSVAPPLFLFFYLLSALIQVIIMLYIAEVLIRFLWLKKIDPDNSAIPYLTAICDVIGTALLALAFLLWFLFL